MKQEPVPVVPVRNGEAGCQAPKDVWHTVEVLEPSVCEDKDGEYGEDGSEMYENT